MYTKNRFPVRFFTLRCIVPDTFIYLHNPAPRTCRTAHTRSGTDTGLAGRHVQSGSHLIRKRRPGVPKNEPVRHTSGVRVLTPSFRRTDTNTYALPAAVLPPQTGRMSLRARTSYRSPAGRPALRSGYSFSLTMSGAPRLCRLTTSMIPSCSNSNRIG